MRASSGMTWPTSAGSAASARRSARRTTSGSAERSSATVSTTASPAEGRVARDRVSPRRAAISRRMASRSPMRPVRVMVIDVVESITSARSSRTTPERRLSSRAAT